MRSDSIVLPAPTLDHDLSLAERVENLTVERLVSEAALKLST